MILDKLRNLSFNLDAIKDISPEDVRNFINERQSAVLAVILFLAGFIIMAVILNLRFTEHANLTAQLEVLRSKEQPVKDYEKITKEYHSFLNSLPPSLSENDMISFVAGKANHRNIQVDSFEPAEVKTKSFYRETTLGFSCNAASFQNILLFLHDLENSKFLVKVDLLDIKKTTIQDTEDFMMSFTLTITSIQLINNEQKKPKKK